MKTTGWILLVFGVLSAIGALIGGATLVGPIFFTALGVYLVSRANKKIKEQKDKDEWSKGSN